MKSALDRRGNLSNTKTLKFVLVGFLTAVSNPAFAADVLLYNGKGACAGCAEANVDFVKRLGFSTEYATPETLDATHLKGARLWIQPGGEAHEIRQVVSSDQLELLRKFISDGGSYLGICAGAFLADEFVDEADTIPGLGILPGETYDYLPSPLPVVMQIMWQDNIKNLYFQGGPGFRLAAQSKLAAQEKVDVFARYPDGTPAAIQFQYGKGNVVLVGPHPEAPASWYATDRLSVPLDLSDEAALQMISRAIGGHDAQKHLGHFKVRTERRK